MNFIQSRSVLMQRGMSPDVPGEYCFPPLASLITGAARLVLAMVEHCVAELGGGTYAMEDTDSMAIVATETGGLVPCPSGTYLKGSQPAVRALSWKQVQKLSARFAALNPYDRDAVPGSVLKIEEDNFDSETGRQRQLHCFAISAKRHTLSVLDQHGEPMMLRKEVNNKTDRWSRHGLGHLMNPTDPNERGGRVSWRGTATELREVLLVNGCVPKNGLR